MHSAWQRRVLKHLQTSMIYLLIIALLAISGGVPAQAGSGINTSSFNSFEVSTDTVAYFSGYLDHAGNYSKETPTYHFRFTTADNLQAGDTIQLQLPYPYNFVDNPSFMWRSNVAIPDIKISTSVNGVPVIIVASATTAWSDEGHPALSFTLSTGLATGVNVDIQLTNFLITSDYRHSIPGLEQFAISTSANPAWLTATHGIFTRNVANYFPDADSYATSAATGYHFKFEVMQPINPTATITLTFPAGTTVPAAILASQVKINNTAVAAAVLSGNKLILNPSVALQSFSTATIDIEQEAQFANPAVPGYYNFVIATSVDTMVATRRIGMVSSLGASLADNPSHDEGYVSVEDSNTLRFAFTTPTILKAGDTVTVSSPQGTVLSNSAISVNDIMLEWSSGVQESIQASPSSVTRVAENQLQFVLPSDYFCDPDYHLVFNIPNVIGYGEFEMKVSTSRTTKPASVILEVVPDTIQNFTLSAGTTLADAQNVPYTFTFQTNMSVSEGDKFNLVFPVGMTIPSAINASSVKVNGTQAGSVTYSSSLRTLGIEVPADIHMFDTVTINLAGSAGLTNPAIGSYIFSVYPSEFRGAAAQATLNFTELVSPITTGIAASPRTVQLKLGSSVSQQLQVTALQSDSTQRNVTAGSEGTVYVSSNAHIATVTANGLIEAKQAGATVITVTYSVYTDSVNVAIADADASSDGYSSPQPVTSVPEKSLNTSCTEKEKEIFASTGGKVILEGVANADIPAGALPANGNVKLACIQTEQAPPLTKGLNKISPIVELTSSSGQSLIHHLLLGLNYDSQKVAAGEKPAIFYYNEAQGRWNYIGGKVNADGTISVEVNQFAKFAVFSFGINHFSDMNGHWALSFVERLTGMGAIHGFEDQTYRPNQMVTRAEFVKMIADALALKPVAVSTAFADHDAIPEWAKGAIAATVQAGLIHGYEEGGKAWFRPNQPMTRAEMAIIFAKVLDMHSVGEIRTKIIFADQKEIPVWAQSAVSISSGQKIFDGYQDETFRPNKPATRAETAKMIYMLLEILHL
ncbi:S-layer homology domain-containing protein [Paenibacillus sp. HWE-109]|uniref:S-layer homology domain-containing protein n=1 Tax=Paenibacillus sp. HWE-109 TaxID=1306526 RepID=UPI001EE13D8E|nr:S-layer homology domain-containing protein [Paenibacillus sp. HWE-109]UKS25000.1 S-layer homology domain-containing protein [Paenibacillus sp. HWE-109]